MNLEGSRVLLTGAAGGIGSKIAPLLARAGARLALVDRNPEALTRLARDIRVQEGFAVPLVTDITHESDRQAVVERAAHELGGIDMLINVAGMLGFNPFEAEDPQATERMFQVNVVAPMLLTRVLLPRLLAQGAGRIVNVGSTFGSIAFPYFASYSASKFALRGFSEALRRELEGTGVGVTYIAPRATRTAFNTGPVNRMNEALKISMDSPERVALEIVRALRNDQKDVYLGWPEALFVRINAVWPRLVDGSLRKQNREMRKYALKP